MKTIYGIIPTIGCSTLVDASVGSVCVRWVRMVVMVMVVHTAAYNSQHRLFLNYRHPARSVTYVLQEHEWEKNKEIWERVRLRKAKEGVFLMSFDMKVEIEQKVHK
jgi:hypothetical protein